MSFALLWSATGQAQPAPLLDCRGTLPDPSWVAGAIVNEQVCFQTILHGNGWLPEGSDWANNRQDGDDRLTAARGPRGLLAIRAWRPFSQGTFPADGLLDFSRAQVLEEGQTKEPGELWWGRIATGSYRCCTAGNARDFPLNTNPLHTVNQSESLLLAVGQESSLRQQASLTSPAQLMAYRQGLLPPWPAAARSLRYEQLAATAVTSAGSTPVAPGTVGNAVVELTSLDPLQGSLHFTLSIDGKTAPLSFPIKRDVEESRADPRMPAGNGGHPYRLREGRIGGGAGGSTRVVDCTMRPDFRTLGSSCHEPDPLRTSDSEGPQDPQYAAYGIFYGAEAQYLAMVFNALPLNPDPANSHIKWGEFAGLIILKRSSIGY